MVSRKYAKCHKQNTCENGSKFDLMMTVYKTEEIAERAREIVENFFQMETQRIHDIIEFHGEVMK